MRRRWELCKGLGLPATAQNKVALFITNKPAEQRNTDMKKILLPVLAALALGACQTIPTNNDVFATNHTVSLPQTEAEFLKRTAHLQQAAKGQSVKEIIYFDENFDLSETPVDKGYFRKSYGLQSNGLYLAQDFFADGRKQTDLFYVTNANYPDSAHARGHLSIYNDQGKLSSVQYVISDSRYSRIDFCKNGELCAEQHFTENTEKEALYLNGKKIDEWLVTRKSTGTESSRKLWYPNGKQAYYGLTTVDYEEGQDSKEEYWLEDGTSTGDKKPDSEAFRSLENTIVDIERQAYDRQPMETTDENSETAN
ncbi:Uncharacterised protein [Neisseria zoodegmatis]|uniref:Lipoprotein n=2 Tax=Neisseria zoodegmatis TaxID=326523 RepID=A0AB38DP68_9NEIS|nr:Uncharacterised protein [Neisseria zoodegmatis]